MPGHLLPDHLAEYRLVAQPGGGPTGHLADQRPDRVTDRTDLLFGPLRPREGRIGVKLQTALFGVSAEIGLASLQVGQCLFASQVHRSPASGSGYDEFSTPADHPNR